MTRSAQNKPALGSTNQPQDCASYSASKSSWRPEGATQGLGRHRPVLTDPAMSGRIREQVPKARKITTTMDFSRYALLYTCDTYS